MMNTVFFSPWSALAGGILIGLSATLLLALNGRIAGISGILNGVVNPQTGDTTWRWLFLIGLVVGGAVYGWASATPAWAQSAFTPVPMLIGGLLVGYGTRMGNGCTSGHGVCGLGRLSPRSLVAVVTFLSTGILTVYLIRHVFGGIF